MLLLRLTRSRAFSIGVALLLSLSTVCLAQESRGSITGKVVDPQNSVVPGATVLVTNTATNVSDKATTNQTGYFEVNFLNPGPYSVSVESAGFKKLVQTGINVSTGDRLALDLHLDIGQTTQSVEVSADAPLLDTTNAATGRVLNTRDIGQLPYTTMNPFALQAMAAGMIFTGAMTPDNNRALDHAATASFDSGGLGTGTNEFLLDGNPVTGTNGGRAGFVTLAAIYALMGVPTLVATSQWNHAITMRVRNLVEGVAGIHERYPSKSILLEGVDTDLFWNGVLDRPFRLFGLDHVYLAPGSEKRIASHPDLGNIGEYILPGGVVAQALQREELVVYDVRGARLRNITAIYAALPRESGLPLRVDAASPLSSYLLGPEWYPSDGDHRWMPRRASLRMGAPASPGRKLYLRGACPDELLRAGPLPVIVTVEGVTLPVTAIRPGENAFELAFPLPDSVVGKAEMRVTVEVGRVIRPASDPRDLGLVFGTFEVR